MKNFNTFYELKKSHNGIQPQSNLKKRQEVELYKLNIQEISKIKIIDIQNQYKIQLHVNFWDSKNNKIYGRTCVTKAIDLQIKENQVNLMKGVDFYYFSQICDRSIQLIIEILLIEIEDQKVKTKQVVGCCNIMAFQLQSFQNCKFKRQNLMNIITQQDNNKISGELIYNIEFNQEFDHLQHLIPQDIIFGSNDVIPGVQIKGDFNDICFEETNLILVNDISVSLSEGYEIEIHKYCFEIISQSVQDLKMDQIQVQSLNLSCYYHNTWKAVNDQGFENNIQLIIDQETHNMKNIRFFCLDNLIVDQIFKHPNCFLIFELYYTYQFQDRKYNYSLGWVPVNIYDYELDDAVEKSFQLITKKSISDRSIFRFKKDDISLNCKIQLKQEKSLESLQNVSQGKRLSIDNQLVSRQQSIIKKKEFNQNIKNQNDEFQKQLMNQKNAQEEINKQFQDLDQQLKQLKEQKQKFKNDKEKYDQQQLKYQISLKTQKGIGNIKQLEEEDMYQLQYKKYFDQLCEFKDQFQSIQEAKKHELDQVKKILKKIQEQQYSVKTQDETQIQEGQIQEDHQQLIQNQLQKQEQQSNKKKGYIKIQRKEREKQNIQHYKLNIKNYLDIQQKQKQKNIDLDIEYKEQKYKTQITIRIIGISYKQINFPNRIYISLNFYDFDQIKSEILSYEKITYSQIFKIIIKETYHKGKHDDKNLSFNFTINENHQLFINYLYNTSVQLFIWDADSQIQFGIVQIPLFKLLRQGKQNLIFQRQCKRFEEYYDVYDIFYNDIIGNIQISFENKIDKNQILQELQIQDEKRKVVSEVGIDCPMYFNLEKKQKHLSQEYRIYQRIKFHKQQQKIMEFQNYENNDQKHRQLQDAQCYRQVKKNTFIKQALQKFVIEEREFHYKIGQTSIIPFEIENQYDIQIAFQFQIQDKEIDEFQIINDKKEWEYYCNCYGYQKPDTFDQISSKFTFMQKGSTKRTYLIKFFTINIQEDYQKYRDVSINCHILNQKLHSGLVLHLKPMKQTIDHIFYFFKQEQKNVKINLPNLDQQSQEPILQCTIPEISTKIINDKIQLNVVTPQMPKDLEFNLMFYQNKHKNKLIVIIQSVEIIDIKHNLIGQLQNAQLKIKSDLDRQIICKTNNNKILSIEQQQPIYKKETNFVDVEIKALDEKINRCQINCFDAFNQKLIYRGIIYIQSKFSNPQSVTNFKSPLYVDSTVDIPITNTTTQSCLLKIQSSDENYIQIIDEMVQLDENQIFNCRIKILQNYKACQQDVLLFAYDEKQYQNNFQLHQISITYR